MGGERGIRHGESLGRTNLIRGLLKNEKNVATFTVYRSPFIDLQVCWSLPFIICCWLSLAVFAFYYLVLLFFHGILLVDILMSVFTVFCYRFVVVLLPSIVVCYLSLPMVGVCFIIKFKGTKHG